MAVQPVSMRIGLSFPLLFLKFSPPFFDPSMARLDIKTAFDEAKPKHVAKIMDSHNTHGWIIAALLSEMSGLEGKVMFECVESSFVFSRCAEDGNPGLGQCGGRMDEQKKRSSLGHGR